MYKSILSAVAISAAVILAAPSAFASVVSGLPTSGASGSGLAGSPAAIDIVADDNYVFSGTYETFDPLAGGVSFTFTALENLQVEDFGLSGLGSQIGDITFTLTPPSSLAGSFIVPAAGFGYATIPNFSMSAGETLSLVFSSGAVLGTAVSLNATFNTTAVPVPAALPLMLTAVGGLAFMRSRKSRAA